MPRQIYDKTKRQLMREMLADWNLQPGQVFTASRAHEWFNQHYPLTRPGSVNAGLVESSTNEPSRMHHKSTNESDDLLFKVDRNQYRLYESGKDPAPIRELVQGDVASASSQLQVWGNALCLHDGDVGLANTTRTTHSDRAKVLALI